MRRQKREQRERQRQERYQHTEFRLERRKLSEHNQTEPSHLPASHPPNSSRVQAPDSRFPSATNPQITKWIMEQSVHYNAEKGMGSEVDMQSSMSSLTNIPERDRPGPGSPVPSYTTTSTYPRRDDFMDSRYYRPSSPPVRDTGPSRATNFRSSFDALESSTALDAHTVSDAPSKFSEYLPAEPEHPLLPPSSSHSHVFMLNSDQTLSSQQMLTPYSQQQNPSQQQQHLDKLSMDVMYHTQLSGASTQGITAMIPKLNTGTRSSKSHLDHSDLKDLEIDEIELEKQRIQLMLYEQQKQKEQTSLERNGRDQVASSFQKDADMQHEYLHNTKEENSDVFPEPDNSVAELKQELLSLERLVSDQRKKYREIKFAREREEQNLKQVETNFREHELMNGTFGLNPTDQNRWQKEQKRRLRELEKIRADRNEHLQKIEYNEHCAKSKLKAFEAQANEIRQLLQKAEGAQSVNSATPAQARGSDSYHPDMLPSKLTSNRSMSRDRPHIDVEHILRQQEAQRVRERHHSITTPAEREWTETSRSTPARVMSTETVSTSTWVAGNEQPDLAKEALTTISESNLTAPTQDDPSPVSWNPGHAYKLNHDPHKLVYNSDFYSTDSRITLTTEHGEQFSQEDRLKEDEVQSMVSIDSPPVKAAKKLDLHSGHFQQEAKQRVHLDYRQQEFAHKQFELPTGTERQETGTRDTGSTHSHPYSFPPHATDTEPWRQSPTWNDQHYQPQSHGRYQSSGYSYSNPSRPRGYLSNQINNPSINTAISSIPSSHDRPVLDKSRVPPTPDVVPSSGTVSPRALRLYHQHNHTERSVSPASRQSDLPAPQSPSYLPHLTMPFKRDTEKAPSISHLPSSTTSLYHKKAFEHHQPFEWSKSAANPFNQSYYATPRQVVPSYSSHNAVRANVGVGVGGSTKHIPQDNANQDEHLYDVPCESVPRPQPQNHTYQVPRAVERDNYLPMKPTAPSMHTHRYVPSREGKLSLGHSYSRGRPDQAQFTSFEDKIKSVMDRSYKAQAPRHPERIQRQQTEL